MLETEIRRIYPKSTGHKQNLYGLIGEGFIAGSILTIGLILSLLYFIMQSSLHNFISVSMFLLLIIFISTFRDTISLHNA